MKRLIHITLSLSLVPCIALAEPSFEGLGTLGGTSSSVSDLSDDGSRVVGASDNGTFTEAYLWSSGSMLGLGRLGVLDSQAIAISDDLSTIVGTSNNGVRDEAFFWTMDAGINGLGHIGPGPSVATGVSADGSVIVGINGLTSSQQSPVSGPVVIGNEVAFRWDATAGIQSLGFTEIPLAEADAPVLPAQILGHGSLATGISADGETIFGNLATYLSFINLRFRVLDTVPYAYTWTEAGGFQLVASDGLSSEVNAANNDLSRLVGDRLFTLESSNGGAPIYSSTELALSIQNDLSDNDSLAVGATTFAVAPFSAAAISAGTARALKPYIFSLGLDPTGWDLTQVKAVSSDGLTMAGEGINPQGFSEGWILQLDAIPEAADLAALPEFIFQGLNSAVLPSVRTALVGQTVTVFASIVNSSDQLASACRIGLADSLPVDFDYHRTDPLTNATVGAQNLPVDIPGGATQSFVIGFTPTQTFPATDLRLVYDCANGSPAAFQPTLNSVRLQAVSSAQPDIVALSATTTNDGLIRLPNRFSSAAFVVAAANVGAAGTIRVSADVGEQDLPIELFICETNPLTSECLQAPSREVTTALAELATATFAIFVSADLEPIEFLPAINRIFVRFLDDDGEIRGATSVALAVDELRNLPFVAIGLATVTGNNTLFVPDTGESRSFTVSISNSNPPETVTIQATNPANLPVQLSLCELDMDGACIAPPSPTIDRDFVDGNFAALAVFVEASASIPLTDRNRVFVTVTTPNGAIGERSVQITTEPQN